MNKLNQLIHDFWVWTGLPKENWGKTELSYGTPDPVWFPQMGDVCSECITMVNHVLSSDEIDAFLFGMAMNAEDEDILDYCMAFANESFLCAIASAGVTFPQSETRWQIAELLRRNISGREYFLSVLQQDSNEYVRQRAGNVIEDIQKSS